jgi:drug/metabolite transporter (DMT)-like permease
MKFKSSSLITLLPALLVMALWGSLFPMIKVGYAAVGIDTTHIPSILVFAGLRFTFCGLILVSFCAVRAKRLELPKRINIGWILLGALSSIILHYGFTYIGLALGEGSKSAIIKQIGFLFLSCFAFLFDPKDKFSVRKVIAGMLGFCGIVATAFDGSGIHFAIGDLLLLLASACSAVSAVITKKSTQRIAPVPYTGYSQLLGGICLLVSGLLLGGQIPRISISALLIFLYICAASIGAYVLWNSLLHSDSISKLSIIKFTEPMFAVLFSGLILGERILRLSYLIALLLLLSALLVEHLPGRKKHERNHI